MTLIAIVCKCLYLIFLTCCINGSESPKLLLFLVDGFRWDYLNRDLPGFKQITSEGVKAEYMISDMPTLSFPNYYSIMTGLHCESHGMVGNYMYDVKHNEEFLIGLNPEYIHSYWWNDAEPLWITAVKEGKRAYMYYWPGCEVEIRGRNVTHCKPFRSVPTIADLHNSIDESVALFKNDSADLVGIYVQGPDQFGHMYGPGSKNLNDVLVQIDSEMKRLLDLLEGQNIRDDVNIMIFSDHGMTEVSPSRVVNITNHIDMTDIDVMLDKGSNVYIWPKNNKTDKVYTDLLNMNNSHVLIYKKEDIPEEWYYKRHYRISPIVLFAETGWTIITPKYLEFPTYPESGPMSGNHGYDKNHEDMRAMFVATGPGFKANFKAKPFANVNLYQVMCKLLNVTPSPHNGTWSLVKDMLKDDVTSSSVMISYSIVANIFLVISLLII